MMTNQSIFDTVVEHFKKQKVQCRDEHICLYRGDNNTSCAFGCIISDEKYTPDMEERPAEEVINEWLPEFTPFQGLIKALQKIHDNSLNNKTLLTNFTSRSLKNLAIEFKLDASKVDW